MQVKSGMKILQPGVLSLVQDAGRQGVSHLGLTQGGVMDRHAWAWGNRLVGNAWGAAGLEITVGGLQLCFYGQGVAALTGAELQARLNDAPLRNWCSFRFSDGDRLQLGHARQGMRSYLAIAGGLKTPVGLGHSRSTVMREKLGGPDGQGQALQAGDWLTLSNLQVSHDALPLCSVPLQWQPDYCDEPVILQVVEGYQAISLGAERIRALYAMDWQLNAASGRMAALFEPAPGAESLLQTPAMSLVSEGLVAGSIQLLPNGRPVVLLAERQTLGGYPKPGAVVPRSLDRLAQVRPGQRVRFAPVQPEIAEQQEQAFQRFFRVT